MESQYKMIKRDIERGKQITPLDALHDYGCFRLAAIIFDIRKTMDVKTKIVRKENGKKYAVYFKA